MNRVGSVTNRKRPEVSRNATSRKLPPGTRFGRSTPERNVEPSSVTAERIEGADDQTLASCWSA